MGAKRPVSARLGGPVALGIATEIGVVEHTKL